MRLIDADALKEALKSDIYVVDYGVEGAIYGMFWSGIEYEIDEQPTVEHLDEISNAYENGYQQGKFEGRKTGKWIRHTIYSGSDHYYYACSECDYRSWSKDNYCSVCGAKMEE